MEDIMLEPQIDFQGIESPTLRSQVKELMDDIIEICPSDAAVKATFRFFHDHFWADIKIASTTAYMTAVDQSMALTDVLDHVKSQLLKQIVDWRIHRFAS
jgi:hypothetical protein